MSFEHASGGDLNNDKRLIAAQIIHDLWTAGDTEQLELLRDQAIASLEKPCSATQQTQTP